MYVLGYSFEMNFQRMNDNILCHIIIINAVVTIPYHSTYLRNTGCLNGFLSIQFILVFVVKSSYIKDEKNLSSFNVTFL